MEQAPATLLEIDTTNLYEAHVGPEGVSPRELAGLGNRLVEVCQAVADGTHAGMDAEYACLNLHRHMPQALPQIQELAQAIRQYPDTVVIGIGGSSLGAKAVSAALADARAPRLHFVENVDPYELYHLLDRLEPARTAVVAISKSGGTLETVAQFLILRQWLVRALGPRARDHQWVITDPNTGWLRRLAAEERLPSLPVPPRVGGRYSVLTAVGLLPLAVAGVDVERLLAGAAANAARCAEVDPATNPALELAALFYLLDTGKQKRVSILMPYVNRLRQFADWYRQLWAESLGKGNAPHAGGEPAGTLPVPALGTVDQHSQLQLYLESRRDKVFTFLTLSRWERDLALPVDEAVAAAFPYLHDKTMADIIDAEFRATRQVVTEVGHPNATIRLPGVSAYALGQLIDLYQRITVSAGLLYGVNPLDQPAVEKGKRLAAAYLSERT